MTIVEFLCETDQVEPGKIFKPKEGTGSGLGAFNVRGAQLVTRDYVGREIQADRLDDGGHSKVVVRVAGILLYTVLKILAFQNRHENKDAYDLIYCLLNFGQGPDDAGRAAAHSAIRGDAQVEDALRLLAERFADADQDGPHAYGTFVADGGDTEEAARLRQEAVSVAREFLAAIQWATLSWPQPKCDRVANIGCWRAFGNDAGGGDTLMTRRGAAADLDQHR